MAWYLLIKFVHILAAVVALGTNITYAVWYSRVRAAPDSALHVLKTIEVLESRVANPAYALALASGLGMAFLGDWWSAPWIHLALGLFALVLIIAVAGYTPTLKAQIRAVEEAGGASPEYERLARRGARIAGVLMFLVVAIVAIMVFKPTFGA